MSGPRGMQLSGTQVIASVLATLTGAIAASYLGVGGTLVGAAVGSLASTMGTEVYKHYLQRSQERLRSAGEVLYHGATRTGAVRTRTGSTIMGGTAAGAAPGGGHAASQGSTSQQGADRDLADQETAVWDRRQYGIPRDPHETQMAPGVATQWSRTAKGGATNGGSPNGSSSGGSSNGDRPGDRASQHAHGSLTEEGLAGGDGAPGGLWGAITSFFGSLTRRQWLTYGGIAAGFFVVVVAGITVFELTIGKPVGAAVWGRHASGTSVGDTLSGNSSPQHKPTTRPSTSPPATPTGSTPASPAPSGVTSSGTPTPTTSVAPSSPSTLPSATPSTGTTGAARSATTATLTP